MKASLLFSFLVILFQSNVNPPMDFRCKIFGHRLIPTFVIDKTDAEYELSEGEYCERCGETPAPRFRIRKTVGLKR